MIMSLKQKKIEFKPTVTLNHNIYIFLQSYMKKDFSFQRRETLLFLSTCMAAVTSALSAEN